MVSTTRGPRRSALASSRTPAAHCAASRPDAVATTETPRGSPWLTFAGCVRLLTSAREPHVRPAHPRRRAGGAGAEWAGLTLRRERRKINYCDPVQGCAGPKVPRVHIAAGSAIARCTPRIWATPEELAVIVAATGLAT